VAEDALKSVNVTVQSVRTQTAVCPAFHRLAALM